MFLWIFVRGVVFIGIFAEVLGLYIFISPSRWRTGYGGVFLRGAPCFFAVFWAVFCLVKCFC